MISHTVVLVAPSAGLRLDQIHFEEPLKCFTHYLVVLCASSQVIPNLVLAGSYPVWIWRGKLSLSGMGYKVVDNGEPYLRKRTPDPM